MSKSPDKAEISDKANAEKAIANQVGNPIIPGSELPPKDGDEQRRRDDDPKDDPCL